MAYESNEEGSSTSRTFILLFREEWYDCDANGILEGWRMRLTSRRQQ